jgi:hypothetical protein
MDEPAANPLIVALLFALRCLLPLAIMLGVSYLLRRWGWLSEPKAPPPTDNVNGQPESPAARRAP